MARYKNLVVSALIFLVGLFMVYNYARWPNQRYSKFIGQQASNIHFTLPSGEKTSLAELQGTVLLVSFWADWCHVCVREMPKLREMEEKLAAMDFRLLAIHVDEKRQDQDPNEFPKTLIYDFSNEDLAPYGVRSIPISFLIDRSGVIREVYPGAQNWSRVARKIQKL